MRREHVLAVSSATLFLSTVLAPCHIPGCVNATLAAGMAGHCVLISEFYPCGLCDDEYFVLENKGEVPVSLRNWTVSDGEGALRFTGDVMVASRARLAISANATSYQRAFGCPPGICLDGPESNLLMAREGIFRLADTGDSIALLDQDGVEADFVAYGVCSDSIGSWSGDHLPALRKGEVARRLQESNLPLDTDSMFDWAHFREFKYGYTDLSPVSASVGPGMLTAFVSPDCGLASVLEAIASAKETLRLCAYEFSSTEVSSALLSRMASGVEVSVLVDGAPAGGMDSSQMACLSVLARSGADVRVLKGNISADVVQHIGPLHAKYIVIDDNRFVALSENFVDSGVPSNPLSGNRGWGLDVANVPLAEYLGRIFDEDSRRSRPDVCDWLEDARFDPEAVIAGTPDGHLPPGIMSPMATSSETVVTLLPSPDSSATEPFLCAFIEQSSSIQVEQFQADLMWDDRWTGETYLNPLVDSVEEALLRGAGVSFLLDSLWFNAEDNVCVAEHLNAFASSKGLEGEARLMDMSGPVSALHNKGLVSDGRLTVVSSNNWGYSSFARNRELAVAVDSEEVAGYFRSVFRMDWEPDREAPVADAGPDLSLEVGESVTLDGGRSTDDRFLARWHWRLEGDGLLTYNGREATYLASRPGKQTIYLLVEDAWGNTGVDSVTVEVCSDRDAVMGPGGRLMLPSAALLGLMSSALGAALARKVNHRNRSSR